MSDLRNAIGILKNALRAPTRRVIAIVGPEALVVRMQLADGKVREANFYRLVAERLLEEQGIPIDLIDQPGPTWILHRAVSIAMEHTKSTTEELRPAVEEAINALQRQFGMDATHSIQPSGALLELAQLNCFRLIVSLTPDDLLPQAIRAAQPDLPIDMAGYSPNLDLESGWPMDVPIHDKSRLRYYQLLGRIGNVGDFAVHEEDALEHLQRFREDAERGAKTLLTDLRSNKNNVMVYLGCGLADWMGRGLCRMLSESRFISGERPYDFFCSTSPDNLLTDFLENFSKKSIILPWSAQQFAGEIRSLCRTDDMPAPWQNSAHASGQRPAPRVAKQAPSVFISYASENALAASRVAEQLQQLGFGEIWLDRKRLVAGDNWDDKIDEAIVASDYFMPLLSKAADMRDDGVYWEEWRKGLDRSRQKFGAFLLPVGIDADHPFQLSYKRIFSGWTRPFYDRHLLHAPLGEFGGDARDQLVRRVQLHLEDRS
jgi:hypothetical protein